MVKDISFVLFCGKAASLVYNYIESNRKIKHDTEHTYERKNICKKTYKALLCETGVYFVIFLISMILGK